MENFPSAAEATVWLLEPTNAMDTLDRGEPVSLSTTTPDKLPVVGVEGAKLYVPYARNAKAVRYPSPSQLPLAC